MDMDLIAWCICILLLISAHVISGQEMDEGSMRRGFMQRMGNGDANDDGMEGGTDT